ncbi:MAG: cysteine hydrolase family protein [Balneolaceae bacterium]|jgi:nicotinamidase-related amidase
MPQHTPALIVIDVQKGFQDPQWGQRNNPDAENKIKILIDHWRINDLPIFHIQHASASENSPLHPGKPGFEMMDLVKPMNGEPVIVKKVNSAFIGTDLESRLKAAGYQTLVIAGLTTNHCVSTTTRMAGNLGFETYLVEDATAAFGRIDQNGRHYDADEIHAVSLANIHGEFAQVLTTEKIIERFPGRG